MNPVTIGMDPGADAGIAVWVGEEPQLAHAGHYSLKKCSPKDVLESAGVPNLPDVPLYYELVEASSEMDGRVDIQPCASSDVCLRVRVDFTDSPPLASPLYFRIATAWVYPSPDNWGLRRWRILVDRMEVREEGDGFWRGDGEWRLWFNVNNAAAPGPGTVAALPSGEVVFPTTHEWTKILDDDSVDTGELILGFETGRSGFKGLGPDVLLFSDRLVADQRIRIQVSGFEEQGFTSDESLGLIAENHGQVEHDFVKTNQGGSGRYHLHYRIRDMGPVQPELSANAAQFMSAYDLSRIQCLPSGGDDVCLPIALALPPPERVLDWHPDDQPLPPGVRRR